MQNDIFDRPVTMETMDVYTVHCADGGIFTVSFPTGTPVETAYNTINGMAPPNSQINISSTESL